MEKIEDNSCTSTTLSAKKLNFKSSYYSFNTANCYLRYPIKLKSVASIFFGRSRVNKQRLWARFVIVLPKNEIATTKIKTGVF